MIATKASKDFNSKEKFGKWSGVNQKLDFKPCLLSTQRYQASTIIARLIFNILFQIIDNGFGAYLLAPKKYQLR